VDPRILKPESLYIWIQIKYFYFKKYIGSYIGFYIWNLYLLILPPDGKIVDSYSRENESSEARGLIL
jgi:hypothetical protein